MGLQIKAFVNAKSGDRVRVYGIHRGKIEHSDGEWVWVRLYWLDSCIIVHRWFVLLDDETSARIVAGLE